MRTRIHWQLVGLTPKKAKQMEQLRDIYERVDEILLNLEANERLLAIARTHLEESLMAANKAIAVHDTLPHDETTE